MLRGEAEDGTQHRADFPLVVDAMRRRLFLKLSLFAALAAQTSRSALAAPPRGIGLTPDKIFYDDRFAGARDIAARFDPRAIPTPVQSDVTRIWTDELWRLSGQRPLSLCGVTTESFHFCLARLLRSHARVETRIRRIGRDLHVWSITSTLSKTG